MDNLIIRIGTACDHSRLVEVNRSAMTKLREFYELRPDSVLGKQALPPRTLVVAEINSVPVGSCEYYLQDGKLCFMSLGVHEDYRGQGVFRKIFQFLESEARRLGCRAISCWTAEPTGNDKIFARAGMEVKGRERSEIFTSPTGAPVNEIYLEKELS